MSDVRFVQLPMAGYKVDSSQAFSAFDQIQREYLPIRGDRVAQATRFIVRSFGSVMLKLLIL